MLLSYINACFIGLICITSGTQATITTESMKSQYLSKIERVLQSDGLCSKERGYYNGTLVKKIPAKNSIVLLSKPLHNESTVEIGEIYDPSLDYEISFDITPLGWVNKKSTILRFTSDPLADKDKYGDRSPIFQFPKNSLQISIAQSTIQQNNPEQAANIALTANTEHSITYLSNWKQILEIDGEKVSSTFTWFSGRTKLDRLKVFYGDNFYSPANVILNNLAFTPLPKQEWSWDDCAEECAMNIECDYWVLQPDDKVCKLMSDPVEFIEDPTHFHGLSDEDCIEYSESPTTSSPTAPIDGICHQKTSNGYYNGTNLKALPARNSIPLLTTKTATVATTKIAELSLPSRLYEISFDLTPAQAISKHSTFLLFTADANSESEKYGDRSPIFKFDKNGFKLRYSQSTIKKKNPKVIVPKPLIPHHMYKFKYTASAKSIILKIDGEVVGKQDVPLAQRPQLPKLDVYIGDNFYATSRVFINNLYFTPLPKINWTWRSCAKECAITDECNYWTLDTNDNSCKLFGDEEYFTQDPSHISGKADPDCIQFENVVCEKELKPYQTIVEQSLPGAESQVLIPYQIYHTIEKNFKLETTIQDPSLSYEIEFNIIATGIVNNRFGGWASILRFTGDSTADASIYGNRAPLFAFGNDSLDMFVCQSTIKSNKNCIKVDDRNPQCSLVLNQKHQVKLIQKLGNMKLYIDDIECINLHYAKNDRSQLEKLEVFASDNFIANPAKAILNNLVFTPLYEHEHSGIVFKMEWTKESCNMACTNFETCDFSVLEPVSNFCYFKSVKYEDIASADYDRALGISSGTWAQQGSMFRGVNKNDEYGKAVAYSKNGLVMAISGWKNDGEQEESGHVQVYEFIRNKNKWFQLGSDIYGSKQFGRSGFSLALSHTGFTIVIGSPILDEGFATIYRYNRVMREWKQLGNEIRGENNGDKFGHSVAMSSNGNTIACGAPGYNNGKGLTKIYSYKEKTWNLVGHAIKCGTDGNTDCGENYESGKAVALSAKGTILAISSIGSYKEDNSVIPGKVSVYQYSNADDTWEQLGDSIWGDHCLELWHRTLFGMALSIATDGFTLAVGAPRHANENRSGQVQIYKFNEENKGWSQHGSTIVGRNMTDGFGSSLALDGGGDSIVIGTEASYEYGYFSYFTFNSGLGTWIESVGMIPGSNITNGNHISSVGVSSDGYSIIVGGYLAEDDKRGFANAFETPECNRDPCDIKHRCLDQTCMKKVLVVRVVAPDSSTTNSSQELSDAIFGTYGKKFTMASQFNACSYGFFKIEPFEGMCSSGVSVEDGVNEVTLSEDIVGKDTAYVSTLVEEEATSKFGDLSQFGFVMFCLPHGTILGNENWKAYAYVDHYLTIYNDLWCTYPSAALHEIGHNLGLTHSNDDISYGDHSGMMGISYTELDGPHMCFNGPKSWQLGWYDGSFITLEMVDLKKNYGVNTIKLIGLVDYQRQGTDQFTVCRILGSDDGYQYYLAFNRKSSFNSGTREGGDKVLFSRRMKEDDDSTLLAKLSSGDKYYFYEYSETKRLKIEVASIYLDEEIPYAEIKLVLGQTCEDEKNCDDGDPCTFDTCNSNNQCVHEEYSCDVCGAKVSLEVQNTYVSKEIGWCFYHVEGEASIFSDSDFFNTRGSSDRSRCLQVGTYKFSISGGNANDETSFYYKLSIGDEIYQHSAASHSEHLEFSICKEDNDCDDFDECTEDICNKSFNLCEFKKKDHCDSCKNVTINLITDNYASETTWSVINGDGQIVMSDGPYEGIDFGRSKAPTSSGKKLKRKLLYMNKEQSQVTSHNLALHERNLNVHNTFSYNKCLLYNTRLFFKIEDSFGDGLCCGEGQGSYSIMVSDQEIQKGGNFTFSEEFYFKLLECTIDSDCDDENHCFESKCLSGSSVCVYRPLACSTCGEMVAVDVITDDFPYETSWTIERLNEDDYSIESAGLFFKKSPVMSGGKFKQSWRSYKQEACLPYGFYKFTILDRGGDGLCFNGKCGAFELQKDDEVVIKGGSNFMQLFEKKFEVRLHTHTLSLSPTPSTKPPTIGSWIIEFDKVLVEEHGALVDELTLQYNIAKDKNQDQIISRILDQDCLIDDIDTSISVKEKKIISENSTRFDKVVISLEYNRTLLMESPQWRMDTNVSGVYEFCLKTELLLNDPTKVSMSFVETPISLNFNFEAGFATFEIDEIDINKFHSIGVNKEHDFEISACVCTTSADSYECLNNPSLDQNSDFKICILPSDGLQVKKFEDIILYQDNLAKSTPVKNGISNTYTSTTAGTVGIIETSLTSAFFEDVVPSPVTIVGNVALDYESTRMLGELPDHLSRKKLASFNVIINLRLSSRWKKTNFLSLASMLLLGVGVGFILKITTFTNYVSFSSLSTNDHFDL